MISHVQLTEQGDFLRYINAGENIEWDVNNYCTAFALEKDGKAEQFHILPYYTKSEPPYNPVTQDVRELDPAPVDGLWTQQWEVYDLSAEEVAANLAKSRAACWDSIKTLRDNKTREGGYKVGMHWYHSDTFSRTQQIGLVMMGTAMPAGLQWKTMDGSFVTMTSTLAQQVFQAAAAQDAAHFAHAEALRSQVEASTDPASIDITAGWPETFGGA